MERISFPDPSAPGIILLEDGTYYTGTAIGAKGTSFGELCFNTGMTGYQEVFTDPSYYGQILVMTSDHIGNYGVHPEEVESEGIKISGLVIKNYTGKHYSRKSASGDLQQYLEENKLVGIADVDTRAMVRHIRNRGVMNAILSTETTDLDLLKARLKEVPSMAGMELSSKVSTQHPFEFGPPNASKKVAVLDLGIKKNILRCFSERGVLCKVFPMNTTFETMEAWQPHGYFISNGPGDPGVMHDQVNVIRQMIAHQKPLFGICMGHQLLAQALGIATYKMFNGHRGLNHPVKNLRTGTCEITSQNHGFSIDKEQTLRMAESVEITHIHLNDDSVAGIRLKHQPVFSVQFHPEAGPGPHDSRYLFDAFIETLQS